MQVKDGIRLFSVSVGVRGLKVVLLIGGFQPSLNPRDEFNPTRLCTLREDTPKVSEPIKSELRI